MIMPTFADSLKYTNLQMAAEAFLVDNNNRVLLDDQLLQALKNGNNHSLLFTDTLATEFAAQWDVVAQKANTPTGFSGTLFRCKVTDPEKDLVAGQLVLSFRSTEFIDDNLRDSAATNALIAQPAGWVFGQIADMEAWYQQLRTAGGPLAGQSFDVTGYSLGGHLATAFGILRGEAGDQGVIKHIYTYNGAGTGDVVAGKTLTAVIQNFSDVLAGVEPMYLNATQRAECLKKAQAGLAAFQKESDRIHSLAPYSGGPLNNSPAGGFNDIRYWYALEVASLDTTGAIWAGNDPLAPNYADPRFMLNTLMTRS